MDKLTDLFDIRYGNNLDLASMIKCENDTFGIPFVSRTERNNGVSAFVKRTKTITPNPAHTLSVAVGGSVLSTFYQSLPYYTGYHVLVLSPKHEMIQAEMLYYAKCIHVNKYRYSYGRQANKTLKDILVPSLEDAKFAVKGIKKVIPPSKKSVINKQIKLDTSNWKTFRYSEIFDIKKGYYNKKPQHVTTGAIPFIGATAVNNGVTERYSIGDIKTTHRDGSSKNDDIKKKIFDGNCIVVTNNGSVGYAYYQKDGFTCSHDVNPLYLKEQKLNEFVALFIATVIEQDRYRWVYGRKWRPKRMVKSTIKLPATPDGNPDWQFMEDYIKSLPYSSNLS